jgi:hypothetical protein
MSKKNIFITVPMNPNLKTILQSITYPQVRPRAAQAAEAERAAEAAASPGGIHHEVLATALNKVGDVI